MRSLSDISAERDSMHTIMAVTSAFEGIASMRIAQIKDQVQSSEKFFGELWRIYSQIRVDKSFHFGRSHAENEIINEKELMILVTSEASLSGDIDQKLIGEARKVFNRDKNDVIIIGHHGSTLLTQYGIPYIKSFKLPNKDLNINVHPLIDYIKKYSSTKVFYQTYISLTAQDVKAIQLSAAVSERGNMVTRGEDVINEKTYIFEPSMFEVIDHLESSMMQITLSEVILESKLAQYASRFRAMTSAESKAEETFADLNTSYNRARRHIKDERLKEVMNGLRNAK
jgi:ATP synthase F1 gamma subunit